MTIPQNDQSPPRPLSPLAPSLNRIPSPLHHIHLMGICGTGMASLAGMLKELGYRVTGSDHDVYPPMSTFLRDLSVAVSKGYGPWNLSPRPDLVIVGNVITRENPEAVELARLAVPYASLPQALEHFAFGEQKSVVIAGTHGKTTTSALAAWVLERAGMDPGFMIGGIPVDFKANYKLGAGDYFVIEGDEYDTAFFDKGPKFCHYRPWFTLLTGIEFDHADIYRDLDHVRESFRNLIGLIPPGGRLIANGDDPVVRAEIHAAACPVTLYALDHPASWTAEGIVAGGARTRLGIRGPEGTRFPVETPLYGRHNLSNLLAVVALARHLDIPFPRVAEALRSFRGIRRRQEVRGERRGVLVLDDFAHHPTAVRETLRAVRDRYPDRRLVAVFEPRSNSSRRKVFQEAYARSFDPADLALIREPARTEGIPPEERFSASQLAGDLRQRGLRADAFPDTDRLLEACLDTLRAGDLVLVMSNGGFDNLIERLWDGLAQTRS